MARATTRDLAPKIAALAIHRLKQMIRTLRTLPVNASPFSSPNAWGAFAWYGLGDITGVVS